MKYKIQITLAERSAKAEFIVTDVYVWNGFLSFRTVDEPRTVVRFPVANILCILQTELP